MIYLFKDSKKAVRTTKGPGMLQMDKQFRRPMLYPIKGLRNLFSIDTDDEMTKHHYFTLYKPFFVMWHLFDSCMSIFYSFKRTEVFK